MANTHIFSKGEEIANAIIHGIGAISSIAALAILVVYSSYEGNAWHIVTFTIFGATMLILYTCSTLVHSFPEGKAKDIFEILDHSSIYLFIAGSYTPFLLLAIKGTVGWTLFGIVWGLTLAGIIFKSFFTKRFVLASTLLYVAMGWLIVFAWKPLVAGMSTPGLVLLIIGGLLYSVGAVFYVWRGFRFHHAIWHLFVVGGSAAHFFSVMTLLP